MKTYTEQQGFLPFDWRKELNQWIERQYITPKDHIDLRKKSVEWVTCACGNQCEIIPRDSKGCPFDEQLQILGARFHDCIVYRQPEDAMLCLIDIEIRSQEIINQIKAENEKQ